NGRFSIIDVIGTGGMGRVYKAIQSPLDRIVALKVLNPSYGQGGRDPNFQRRFFLEASLTAKLRSPNTITVHDYGKTDDGIFYIAMEYVEGQTLAQVLSANGPLPWIRVLHIGQQICRSLREAHKAGIIHRDLKPANVMLLSEEADQDLVKVLDFGLVKLVGTDEPEITQAGMMLGSPLYMAPEQARHIADARSDIYSLGVLMYQALMGRPPFMAKESVDAIVKHLSQKPPRFAEVRPDLAVPAEIEAVVMKCLEKDPDRRYQSMDELLEGMRAAASSQGVSGLFGDPRGITTGVRPALTAPQSAAAASPLPPPLPTPPPGDGDAARTRAERSAPSPRVGSGVTPAPAEQSLALDLVEEVPRPGRKYLLAAAFAGSIVVGASIVLVLNRPSTPTQARLAPPPPPLAAPPERAVEPPPPAPTPAPEPVRFRVVTEPAGARVMMGDRPLGTAPVEFEIPAGENGIAEATLSLSLDGYVPLTLTARGAGPTVTVNQKLVRKRTSVGGRKARETKSTDDGYKDDPY
ncbi:MAG: serine/threonine protein kinase, partial [Myxococcaceae bacterium]|nr:serine/threonine protein kinase [Myxococcaceae bacterium]